MEDKIIVGLTAPIFIHSNGISKEIIAKVDSGATKSSIDTGLATELKLGPIIKSKMVKSAHGNKVRPVVEVEVELAGKRMKSEFTIADRTHMTYKVLVGINVLEQGFLIDPSMKETG